MPRTSFRVGDRVSCGSNPATAITGTVVELRRRADNAPFLMVEITSGPKAGTRDWPDEAWRLGIGTLEDACERCGRQFRHQPGEHTCYRCDHLDEIQAQRQAADPARRSTSWETHERQRRTGS